MPATASGPVAVWASGGVPGDADHAFEIPAMLDADTGAVTLALDSETIEILIEDALAMAAELLAPPTVTLDLIDIEGAASLTLNMAAIKGFAEAGVALTLIFLDAEVTLSPEALAMLAEAADDAPVTIEAIMDHGLMMFFISVSVGGETMETPVTVSLMYAPEEANPAAARVWHTADDGDRTLISSVYDPDTAMVTFTTNLQGYFGFDPTVL